LRSHGGSCSFAFPVLVTPASPSPWGVVRKQISLGAQLEPYLLFSYLNLRIDVFFVARYRALRGVGLYSVAVIFSELVWLATDALTYSVSEAGQRRGSRRNRRDRSRHPDEPP